MCRLLAYIAREPVALRDLLADSFEPFVELSKRHKDGWGLAWYDGAGHLHRARKPEAAYASREFGELARQVQADTLIAHLRQATPGLNVCVENTHPFTYEEIAFAHNGSIEPVDEIEELIDPHLRQEIQGTTDSERYFLALVSALDSVPPQEALGTVLRQIHERFRYTSLNCLLLTPLALYTVCLYNPRHPKIQKRLAGEPDYVTISYRITPNGMVIGSSGWQQGEDWQLLCNGQILRVERNTLRTTVMEIDGYVG